MKAKRHLFIGLVLGIVLGWALGFLRFPYLEKNNSFLLGFLEALAVVSLVFVLLNVWNRNLLLGLMGNKSASRDPKTTHTHTYFWILLVGLITLGGIIGGLYVYRQQASFKMHIQQQDKKLREMTTLVEAVGKNELEPIMRSLLEDVGDELKRHPGRRLSDSTIARIAALSITFKPYKFMEGDSLSEKPWSPERGHLLQALILMHIDTGSFAKIMRKTLFVGADLRGADLKGLDLSGINLRGANLKKADLSGANLKGAILAETNLWGAILNKATLSYSDLKAADLSWAQLNEAVIRVSNLNGANLSNAQLRKSDLDSTTLRWAQSGGALFNEANLMRTNFAGTNLSKVNFNQANLRDSDLRKINLSEADLVGAILNKALVDQNWIEKLKVWRPIGLKELQEAYSVVNDSIDKIDKRAIYRLKKN